MNRLKLWLHRQLIRWEASLRVKPPERDLSGVVSDLAAAVMDSQFRESWERRGYVERCHELYEAGQMAGTGPWLPATVRESVNKFKGTLRESFRSLVGLTESFPNASAVGGTGDLELALQNVEWRREVNLSWMEFSRWGIQQIILISRLYYIKNPIIRRLIDVDATYVFGRGMEVSSEDPDVNDAIAGFLALNKCELGHAALVEHQKRTNYDGNLFFVFFPDTQSKGAVPMRTIDATEIQDIVTDPEDTTAEWYFRRMWTERVFDPVSGETGTASRNAWYPAIEFEPEVRLDSINGYPVMWSTPVYHRSYGKVGKWLFGCPPIYPALDWAKADRRYLEACATLAASHAQIAMTLTTKGGQAALAGTKQQLSTTVGPTQQIYDKNPTAVDGSIFAAGTGTSLAAFHSRGQGLDPKEHREYGTMAAMCLGVPPTWIGDMETANLATATTLDRPTELGFANKQESWTELITTIYLFALNVQLRAPGGKLREALEARDFDVSKVRLIERPRVRQPDGRMTYVTEAERKTPKKDTDLEISVVFPPIREGDLPTLMGALVEAITLNGFEAGTGIDVREGVKAALSLVNSFSNTNIDIEEVIEKLYPESQYSPLMDRTKLMAAQQQQALNPPAPPQPDADVPDQGAPPEGAAVRKPHPHKIDAAVTESYARLRAATQKLTRLLERGKKAA